LFLNSADQFEGINEEGGGIPHLETVNEGHGEGNLQITITITIFTPLHVEKASKMAMAMML
jgi:hypothetical protein